MTLHDFKNQVVATLTVFSSFSTLLCCALPAALVAIGAGSVMAGLVSTVPQIVVISHYKPETFMFAGVMLSLSAYTQWRNRNAPCPIEPEKAKACKQLRAISAIVFFVSLSAYLTGVFFTFIAPRLAA